MCTTNMKNDTENDSSGVVFEMLRAGGEPCLTSLIGRFNDLYFEGRLGGG